MPNYAGSALLAAADYARTVDSYSAMAASNSVRNAAMTNSYSDRSIRLMIFVAKESGVGVGPLTVISTHACIDSPKSSRRSDIPPHCRVANTDVMTVREVVEYLKVKAFPKR